MGTSWIRWLIAIVAAFSSEVSLGQAQNASDEEVVAVYRLLFDQREHFEARRTLTTKFSWEQVERIGLDLGETSREFLRDPIVRARLLEVLLTTRDPAVGFAPIERGRKGDFLLEELREGQPDSKIVIFNAIQGFSEDYRPAMREEAWEVVERMVDPRLVESAVQALAASARLGEDPARSALLLNLIVQPDSVLPRPGCDCVWPSPRARDSLIPDAAARAILQSDPWFLLSMAPRSKEPRIARPVVTAIGAMAVVPESVFHTLPQQSQKAWVEVYLRLARDLGGLSSPLLREHLSIMAAIGQQHPHLRGMVAEFFREELARPDVTEEHREAIDWVLGAWGSNEKQ